MSNYIFPQYWYIKVIRSDSSHCPQWQSLPIPILESTIKDMKKHPIHSSAIWFYFRAKTLFSRLQLLKVRNLLTWLSKEVSGNSNISVTVNMVVEITLSGVTADHWSETLGVEPSICVLTTLQGFVSDAGFSLKTTDLKSTVFCRKPTHKTLPMTRP